jgi:D-serine deaminase-like pyridoxal phosphate-dependent protein
MLEGTLAIRLAPVTQESHRPEAESADGGHRMTRRVALGSAAGTALALQLSNPLAVAGSERRHVGAADAQVGALNTGSDGLGRGGKPMSLAAVAAVAKRIGNGEPVAIVDLAAVDHNCKRLLAWSARNGIAWRPAYKTLRSPELLEYVLAKLDRPRVMIHHLRDLSQALKRVPPGTDFLMGYPPTVGELRHYLRTRPPRNERRHKLRINVDSLKLLRRLDELSKHTPRTLPIDVALEIYSGVPRGGLDPGAELTEALRILRRARRRLRLSALMCYDVLAAGISDEAQRKHAARFAQRNLAEAHRAVIAQARDFVDVAKLRRNGPGSSNYTNWAGSRAANEFSAGSAVLFANYLDPYSDVAPGLAKALYMCAPVLRTPKNIFFDGGPYPIPAGTELVFIKSGGWPTGNNPTLSKLAYPAGLLEGPVYGRGSNASGLILAPKNLLALGEYVVETPQQVMEGQDYFGGLYAVRERRVRALWPTVSRWVGRREELR